MKIRVMLVLCAGAVALAVGVSTASAAPACGTITSSTTLTSDCAGPLTVGASGITVDLGGHTVLCSGIPGVTGIDVGSSSNVVVENGSVSGCEEGVLADGGNSNQFLALALTNNNVGFEISNSASTTIMRNQVTGSPFTGMLLFQTSGFLVHRNTVLDSGIGIFDNGGTNNVISQNTASRGVGISDVGILLNAQSDTVVHNSTLANGTGIWVSVPLGGNRLVANTSTDNNLLDMRDDAAGCGSNTWKANTFKTANQPCIQ
jgi:parallel beta-helix repeat protein